METSGNHRSDGDDGDTTSLSEDYYNRSVDFRGDRVPSESSLDNSEVSQRKYLLSIEIRLESSRREPEFNRRNLAHCVPSSQLIAEKPSRSRSTLKDNLSSRSHSLYDFDTEYQYEDFLQEFLRCRRERHESDAQ